MKIKERLRQSGSRVDSALRIMALEDRVSPQSAPSPPGVPHSPQSTASPSILDMSLHSQRLHSPHHMAHTISEGHTHLIPAFSQKMSPPVHSEDRFSSDNNDDEDEEIVIKEEEENDSVIMDEQDQQEQISAGIQPPQLPCISFSITNILSDRFGKRKICVPEKKTNGTIFRPFEISRRSPSPQPIVEKSAFTRLIPEVIDYSRPPPPSAVLPNPLMIERANFLNCFNPATYPRIHEEILNSRRNGCRPNDIKMPPLGSLCKTVSQIGQTPSLPQQSHCLASPPPSSSISSSSVSSTSASPASGCRVSSANSALSPQPMSGGTQSLNGRDSGMESSDDTRSESGSTKDDNGQQLWPAWVYCTRYSDRPSSG